MLDTGIGWKPGSLFQLWSCPVLRKRNGRCFSDTDQGVKVERQGVFLYNVLLLPGAWSECADRRCVPVSFLFSHSRSLTCVIAQVNDVSC